MKIVWTEPAEKDLQEIKAYISRDSAFYAMRLARKMITAVESLERFPHRGRVLPEYADACLRELLFHNYRLIYRVKADHIYIIAIVHGARDFKALDSKPWEVE